MGLLPSYCKNIEFIVNNNGTSNSDPVDAMFEAYIGHSFKKSHELYRSRRDRIAMLNSSLHLVSNLVDNGTLDIEKRPNKTSTTTTENPNKFMATLKPNIVNTATYTKTDFLRRRKLRQLEELIKSPSVVQEFLNDDDFDTLTRRFDDIPITRRAKKYVVYLPRKPGLSFEEWKLKVRKNQHFTTKQRWYWNYDYPYFMNGYHYTLEKNKTMQIMHSLVHEVRYKLVYPQLIRKKYHKSIRYRLGYLFAMLRHLQRQSRLVYHELDRMAEYYVNLYPTIKLLDKIGRLATDVKDVIKLIRTYELERKMVEDPQYYDNFPSSTLPKWRRADPKKQKRRNLTAEEIKIFKKNIELERLRVKV